MWKTALTFLVLAGLLSAYSPVNSAIIPGQEEVQKVIVGDEGIHLYPRFNKSLEPLALLEKGQTLHVLREFKAWKQVQVAGSDQKGWIAVTVEKRTAGDAKKYDTIADPSTTGLVARGWSKDYAASHGADFSKLEKIKKRKLAVERFMKFLEGEDK